MPWIFNPFTCNFDYYQTGSSAPVTPDGVLLSEYNEYIITEANDYLAFE